MSAAAATPAIANGNGFVLTAWATRFPSNGRSVSAEMVIVAASRFTRLTVASLTDCFASLMIRAGLRRS
jgi:hypothetical protein